MDKESIHDTYTAFSLGDSTLTLQNLFDVYSKQDINVW